MQLLGGLTDDSVGTVTYTQTPNFTPSDISAWLEVLKQASSKHIHTLVAITLACRQPCTHMHRHTCTLDVVSQFLLLMSGEGRWNDVNLWIQIHILLPLFLFLWLLFASTVSWFCLSFISSLLAFSPHHHPHQNKISILLMVCILLVYWITLLFISALFLPYFSSFFLSSHILRLFPHFGVHPALLFLIFAPSLLIYVIQFGRRFLVNRRRGNKPSA